MTRSEILALDGAALWRTADAIIHGTEPHTCPLYGGMRPLAHSGDAAFALLRAVREWPNGEITSFICRLHEIRKNTTWLILELEPADIARAVLLTKAEG